MNMLGLRRMWGDAARCIGWVGMNFTPLDGMNVFELRGEWGDAVQYPCNLFHGTP